MCARARPLSEGVVGGITSKLRQPPSAVRVISRERGSWELLVHHLCGRVHQPSKGEPSEALNESASCSFKCRVHLHKLA